MLNRKINNFNDFSRYYSEENQELLEKKSKLDPYIMFSILLILILFSYSIYTFLFQKKQINNTTSIYTNNIPIKKILSPLRRKNTHQKARTLDNKNFIIVQKSDNLSKITERTYGNPNVIYIEQKLALPIHQK